MESSLVSSGRQTSSPAGNEFEVRRLSGFGGYPRVDCHVWPLTESLHDLREVFHDAPLTPRGLGRSYGDAALPAIGGLVLETTACDAWLDFDETRGIVRAQAGISLRAMLPRLVAAGWFFPVTPGTQDVTLGGALAANVHGKNHHRSGAISGFVERLTVLTERGEQECGPATQSELFRATLGGFGATGLIREATLRLRPIETAWIDVRSLRGTNLEEVLKLLDTASDDEEYSIAWIDTSAPRRQLGRGWALLGRHVRADELSPRLQPSRLRLPRRRAWRVPQWLPGGGLNRATAWAFNAWQYHGPRRQRTLTPLTDWFYPLDGVVDWNRLYGTQGFVQYHCVLPHERDAVRGIGRLLEALAHAGASSFVAGLKSMSRDEVLLPFAQPGYTFGVDLSRRLPGLTELLPTMDRIVLEHGGRVALSKDARLAPDVFRQMYPEFSHWRSVVRHWCPASRFRSRLAERLQW
ncbi:MAG: FAD-binding oxidoreductase [Pirellulales bacterium]|nr:FAD-binding oxidoreductase [Pirellulales bacterium]